MMRLISRELKSLSIIPFSIKELRSFIRVLDMLGTEEDAIVDLPPQRSHLMLSDLSSKAAVPWTALHP